VWYERRQRQRKGKVWMVYMEAVVVSLSGGGVALRLGDQVKVKRY
jgi:hypothetical protein